MNVISGALIIDKPSGMTSHDVVQRVRRRLQTRKVGHAGTLDPMATGVLVVLVGEGTKLVPFLTANDKRYHAEVQLGRSTDTLDAEGETTHESALPAWWPEDAPRRIEEALASERLRTAQDPPIYSAIKVGGRSAHARVRAGEQVTLEPRPVAVRSLVLDELDPAGRFTLRLTVAKGYYVRSLARDLGIALDVPAHLCGLRREASGVFDLSGAVALDAISPDALLTVEDAASRALPVASMTEAGTERARCGAKLDDEDFAAPPPAGRAAWMDPRGQLVAIGKRDDEDEDVPKVIRVFNPRPT